MNRAGRPHRLHARGIREDPAAQRRLQRQVRLSLHPGRACGRGHQPEQRPRSSPPSSAGWTTTRLRARRVPAQHPPHRRDPAGRQVRLPARGWQPGVGLGREAGRAQRPGYAERGELTVTYLTDAHRACGAAAGALDARRLRLRRGGHRRRGQRGRRLPRHGPQRQAPAHRQPLRHGAQRRQVRRAAGHLRADGLRARTAPPARRLPFDFEVWSALPKRKASATRPVFLGSALAGHFDPAWLDQKDADGITMREAMQHAGLCVDDIPAEAAARPEQSTRASSKCTSSRAGAQRDGPAAGHRHLDQRQRASSARDHRHGQPRRHHADGPPPRRRRGAAELALYLEKRGASEPGPWRRWACWRCPTARSTSCRAAAVQPGRARHHQPGARDGCIGDVRRAGAHLRAPRPAKLEETIRAAAAPAHRHGSSAGSARWPRWACRCSACPAAPATTR